MANELFNMTTAKGVIAILIGLMFIFLAAGTVIQILIFCTGIFLLYYGLSILDIVFINKTISTVKLYLQKFLS